MNFVSVLNSDSLCTYLTDKKFGYSKMNATAQKLLDMWVDDSCSFFERVFSRELEVFVNEFSTKPDVDVIYRGFYLDNTDDYFYSMSDEDIIEYLFENGRLLESASRSFDVALNFAEEYAEGQDVLSIVVECKANKYMNLPKDSEEQEVILYQPIYENIVYKRKWTI